MKKLIKRADVIILCAILLMGLLLLLFFAPRGEGESVIVRLNGEEIDHVDLSRVAQAEERVYQTDAGEIVVSFAADGVRILHSPCRGQNCVHSGKVHKNGAAIVCLPLAFDIRVQGSAEFDGVTG